MNLQTASAAEEQSSVAGIRDVTRSIPDQVRQAASTSRSLNDLASRQQEWVERFRA